MQNESKNQGCWTV